jgi:hypothetical protein
MEKINRMIEKQGERILSSRWVLYTLIFMSFLNMVGHSISKDYQTVIIFILVSYVTSAFSKNMIVILAMGLVCANVFKYGARMTFHEGMEPKEASSVDEPDKKIDTPDSNVKVMDIASRKKDLDFIKSKYNDLLKLQDKIINNVGSLETTLTKMNGIVNDVRDNVVSFKDETDELKKEATDD